jgi:hypothetical protein
VRPPCCAVCGSSFDQGWSPDRQFRVVEFADYDPPTDGRVGGPWPGSEWFCEDHAQAADGLAAQGLTLEEALRRILEVMR